MKNIIYVILEVVYLAIALVSIVMSGFSFMLSAELFTKYVALSVFGVFCFSIVSITKNAEKKAKESV